MQQNQNNRSFTEISGGSNNETWKPQANEKNGMAYDPNGNNTIEGYFSGEREVTSGEKPFTVANIQLVNPDGSLGQEVDVIMDTVLKDRLSKVSMNAYIRLTYQGRAYKKGYANNVPWSQTNSYHVWWVGEDKGATPLHVLTGRPAPTQNTGQQFGQGQQNNQQQNFQNNGGGNQQQGQNNGQNFQPNFNNMGGQQNNGNQGYNNQQGNGQQNYGGNQGQQNFQNNNAQMQNQNNAGFAPPVFQGGNNNQQGQQQFGQNNGQGFNPNGNNQPQNTVEQKPYTPPAQNQNMGNNQQGNGQQNYGGNQQNGYNQNGNAQGQNNQYQNNGGGNQQGGANQGNVFGGNQMNQGGDDLPF